MLNLKFPEVKRFYRAAEAHLDAARVLLAHCPKEGSSTRGHEVVYLSGYAVECSLKALLLTQSPRKQHQKVIEWFKTDLKHNLERLKVELTKKGIHVSNERSVHLKRVCNKWRSEMRYDVRGWQRVEATWVLQSAEQLFNWVKGG
jgi:hypothetical protein